MLNETDLFQLFSEFAREEFGESVLVETTGYGFLAKVRNRKKTYDKHGFKPVQTPDGIRFAPVGFSAWTLKIPLQVADPDQIQSLRAQKQNDGIGFITPEQDLTLRQWQNKLRWVWNGGLDALQKISQFLGYNKKSSCQFPLDDRERLIRISSIMTGKPQESFSSLDTTTLLDRLIETKSLTDSFEINEKKQVVVWQSKNGYADCCPLSLILEDGCRVPITRDSYKWHKDENGEWTAELLLLSSMLSPKRKRAKRAKFRPRCVITPIPNTPYAVAEDELGQPYISERYDVHWQDGTVALKGMADLNLYPVFAQQSNPDKPWLKEIPSQPVRYVLKELAESWNNFFWNRNGAGEPRFKSHRRGDQVNCLGFEDANALSKEFDEQGHLHAITIPRLGKIVIPPKYRRKWKDLAVATVRISDDCGWTLQITTAQRVVKQLKPKATTATLEIIGNKGVLFVDDTQRPYTIEYSNQLRLDARIASLQHKLEQHRELLRKAEFRAQLILAEVLRFVGILPVPSIADLAAAFPGRTITVVLDQGQVDPMTLHLMRSRDLYRSVNRAGRFYPTLSGAAAFRFELLALLFCCLSLVDRFLSRRHNRIKQIRQSIRWFHRRTRLSRRALNQKLSTFVLRRVGKIIVRDKPHGTILKPEPIPGRTLKSWEPNGAGRVSKINRERTIHTTGQFVALLQQKGAVLGRVVEVQKPEPQSSGKKKKQKQKQA